MNLVVNELLKQKGTTENTVLERILWIDEDHTIAATIDVLSIHALPQIKNVAHILNQIEAGELETTSEDPFYRIIDEEKIEGKFLDLRNRAWDVICNAVLQEPEVYYREERGAIIRKIMEEHGVTKRLIYKYLRKYWQRGKNKNTLLPDYYNSGGKGKPKTVGKKKIGRPRSNPDITGVGFNVDDATKRIFKVAVNKYFYTAKKNPLTTTYELMVKNYYAEDSRYEDGIEKPVLKPMELIPTFAQFKYWYYKELDLQKAISSRKGKKNYELNHRQILGRSDTEVMGPGSKYQIDATVADVYLKSRYNRDWIIGRPVIYVVIDVFSRMVAGLYVGLEGPSWLGAMMALANAAGDKTKFCSEYNINITEEEWPCRYLPEAILADRGEIEGKMINTLINALHVRVENTPPYRADWKGIVEQSFRTLNIKVKPFLPGFIDTDYRQRGGTDYRLDAQLNIADFTEIIIRCILHHNNRHCMKNYSRDEMMISDDVNPVPREIWDWGIKNRSGRLRSINEDIVRLNLMPTANVTITEKGIKFKNMFYSCDRALSERWFEKARNQKSWKEEISYDPRNMDYIYLRMDEGKSFDKCYLLNKDRYGGKTLEEIAYLDAYETQSKQKKANEVLQNKVDLYAEIENIVARAGKRDERSAPVQISNTAKVKGIREHRKLEKSINRQKEFFELGTGKPESETPKKADIYSITGEPIEEEDDMDEIEYLMRKQRERMGKKDE